MTYRPNPESLAARVLGFFVHNPDEELSLEDITLKFVDPGDSRNVHSQLIAACDHDMLIYTPEDDTYRKGPTDLPSAFSLSADDQQVALLVRSVGPEREPVPAKASVSASASPTPKPKSSARKATQNPFAAVAGKPEAFDLAAVKIEKGIPIPEPGQEWRAFLAKFEVGDSAELPAGYLMKVRTAAKETKAAGCGEFTIRSQANTIRVWRKA